MPKLKTHKGTAKRVKISGSGKIIRERAFGNHILAKKSKARKRNMKTAAAIANRQPMARRAYIRARLIFTS